MDAMVNKSRLVAGKGTSLLELGYNRVGVDGGWSVTPLPPPALSLMPRSFGVPHRI